MQRRDATVNDSERITGKQEHDLWHIIASNGSRNGTRESTFMNFTTTSNIAIKVYELYLSLIKYSGTPKVY